MSRETADERQAGITQGKHTLAPTYAEIEFIFVPLGLNMIGGLSSRPD